jgi:hypothetical protein
LSNREDLHHQHTSNQPNQQNHRPTWLLSSTRNYVKQLGGAGLPQEAGNQKYPEEQATLQQQVIVKPQHT